MEGKEGKMTDMIVSLFHEFRKEFHIGIFEPDRVGTRGRGSGWKRSGCAIRDTSVCSCSREGVDHRSVLVPGDVTQGEVLGIPGIIRHRLDWFGRGRTSSTPCNRCSADVSWTQMRACPSQMSCYEN